MAQYWIQTPVENAKEVVQRYIDANSGTLTAYAGATVSYDEQCEVLFYGGELSAFPFPNSTVIYFGNLILPNIDNDSTYSIYDGNTEIITLTGNKNSGTYKGIIFNICYDIGAPNSYFVGYKFNITTP